MAFRAFGRRIERGFAVVGLLTIGSTSAIIYSVRQARSKAADKALSLPDAFVLDLDFEGLELVEKAAPPWAQAFGQAGRTLLELRKIVNCLEEAGEDERVKGLFATIGGNQSSFTGLAQVQEVRNAVASFREKAQGRAATIAFADSFGETGTHGTVSYYLASAFDKVFMQPSGLLSVNGIAASTPFLKRFLERWSIKPLFFAREKYKNIVNQFTEDEYTPQHREATEAILSGFIHQIVHGIASDRGLEEAHVRQALDAAPLTCKEAVARQLVDASAYRDQALHTLPRSAEGKDRSLPCVPVVRYIKVQDALRRKRQRHVKGALGPVKGALGVLKESVDADADQDLQTEAASKSSKPAVALITAFGPIVAGKGTPNDFIQQENQIASGPLCNALTKARNDPSVKAVVLRIDSPGGSAVASDTIYREVLRTRESGKPVIVSMGNVAASGGYYISAPATKILAQPATMTGSIGVAFGKFNFLPLLRDLGINVDTVSVGANAEAMLPFTDFKPEQEAMLNNIVDDIYMGFLTKVAAGRKKPLEEIRKVAQGRIWTGEAALANGLVDSLGGLKDAILIAKQEAGLTTEDESAVEIKEFPRQRPLIVQVLQRLRGSGPDAAFLAGEVQVPQLLQSAAAIAMLFSRANQPGLLDNATWQALQAAGLLDGSAAGPRMVAPRIDISCRM